MSDVFNKFVNHGTDMDIIKNIDPDNEDLIKSFHKNGLVQVQRTVNGKYGQYQRMQWVRSSDVKESDKVVRAGSEGSKRDSRSLWVNVYEGSSEVLRNLEKKYKVARDNEGKKIEFKFLPLKNSSQAYPLSEVIKHYHKSETKLPLEKFIEKNYFISNGRTQTKDCYCRNGEYTPERQKLHDSIVSKIVESAGKPKEGEKPVCILLGGGSGSGKSTVRDLMIQPELDENEIKVGKVDSDAIKEELPEYEPFQEQDVNSAAFRVHEESGDIVDEAIDTLIYEKRHFIYDGTMKNPKKYKRIIQNLKDAGYEVRVVGVDLPLDEAIKRVEARAKRRNRAVPIGIVKNSHKGFATSFSEIAELADDYEIYDNSGEFPVLMKDKASGVQDEKLWNRFVEKGKTKSGGNKDE